MPETAWSLPLHCFTAAAAALVAFSRCLLGDVHFTNFDDDRNYTPLVVKRLLVAARKFPHMVIVAEGKFTEDVGLPRNAALMSPR